MGSSGGVVASYARMVNLQSIYKVFCGNLEVPSLCSSLYLRVAEPINDFVYHCGLALYLYGAAAA